ncbi:MAG: phosphoribosylglycinamide synthetase C domain-containing protein [Nanoarchaeota archaeon]|nr:phosphoribosylglycinamide synthetase C domain-containing protein [Nanoarchaeota archaeon]
MEPEKQNSEEEHKEQITAQPKKFLFVGSAGMSSDLAWQVKKEGDEVKMYVGFEGARDICDGFVEKVEKWQEHKEWADVIVFEDTGFGNAADALRRDGKSVIGGNAYTDRLESDREFGQSEMRSSGMMVLPHWDFSDFETALEFIKSNPGRYVFKPSGEVNSDEKGILFIGSEEDGKDIIEVLEHNKKSWSKKIKKFQLQKYAAGVEIAAGAFFNGNDFISPVNINFEHKKLFPGDIGPYTGEMGTLMFWAPETIPIFQLTLGKMREKLRQSKYVGYIDINCMANGKGIYPLEFTCRFGYPTISIQMEGVLSKWGDFFASIAKGEQFDLKTKKGFQLGVVIAVPPFPYEAKKTFEVYKDSSILFKKPNLEGIHIAEVKLVDGDWHLAGESGYVLVVTGSNSTVETARKQAYRRIQNIMLQNMFYRTDIGIKWYHESDQLQTWGYI